MLKFKPSKPVTLLVVDNEPEILQVLTMILRQERCYQVLAAGDGPTALVLAQEKRPDLIILDFMMPNMSGHEVLKALREDERTKHIPVIMLTSMGDDASIAASLKLGAVCHLSKPVAASEFLSEIQAVLAKRRGMR